MERPPLIIESACEAKCEKPGKQSFVYFNFCAPLRKMSSAGRHYTQYKHSSSYVAENVLMERARIKFGTNNDITGHQTIRLLLCCESTHIYMIYDGSHSFHPHEQRERTRGCCLCFSLALISDKLNALRTHDDTTGVYSHQALGRAESPSPPDSVTSF
jgi:hypothetical protein